MYNDKVLDYFRNPRNMGRIENPDGVGQVGNPRCGDIMTVYIKVKDGIVEDVKFETLGCVAAIATSGIVTEMAKGKTIVEAEKLDFKSVVDELGGLPPVKIHCSDLAVKGLRKAIEDYKTRNT